MKILKLFLICTLVTWCARPARADVFPLNVQRVSQALGLDGFGAGLIVPRVSSRVREPGLKVTRTQIVNRAVYLRAECVPVTDCPPFYVRMSFDSRLSADEFSRRFRITRTETHGPSRSTPVLVRRGELATLHIVRRSVSLHLMVHALQSGRLGEPVRVRDEVTRTEYLARIIGSREVRAEE